MFETFKWIELVAVEHPASRASFYIAEETVKEALHKSASSFEVAVAPNLGLVSPV